MMGAGKDCAKSRKGYSLDTNEFLFTSLTSRLASWVKVSAPDMRDCHSATAALQGELHSRGFDTAKVVGVSALVISSQGLKAGCGAFTLGREPAHSVVFVSGYVLDPTSGQFRTPEFFIPDYIVIGPSVASCMLESNRRWIENGSDELVLCKVVEKEYEFQIAYVPTDPQFVVGNG